jgi:hypothetical protein
MKTHVLRGSKQDIADGLAQISGEVREAIIFVDEPAAAASAPGTPGVEDIIAEMHPSARCHLNGTEAA